MRLATDSKRIGVADVLELDLGPVESVPCSQFPVPFRFKIGARFRLRTPHVESWDAGWVVGRGVRGGRPVYRVRSIYRVPQPAATTRRWINPTVAPCELPLQPGDWVRVQATIDEERMVAY